MLHLVDESIEAFLRAVVPLGSQEIDVAFNAPNREWSAQLNRPTVNIFLWDIARSTNRMESGFQRGMVNGVASESWVPTPVEFRYLVTAWTADHSDEHQLLGQLLRTLLGAYVLPTEYMAGELSELPEPTITTPTTKDRVQTDLWKALDGQLKPGIEITLTLDIPTGTPRPLAAPTEEFGIGVDNLASTDDLSRTRMVAGEVRDPAAPGITVIGPRGTTRINEAGNFLIKASAGDQLTIELDSPITVTVPESGGIRITP